MASYNINRRPHRNPKKSGQIKKWMLERLKHQANLHKN